MWISHTVYVMIYCMLVTLLGCLKQQSNRSFIKETNANIKLSSPEDSIPGIRDRLVTVIGSLAEQVHAVSLIMKKISEDTNYLQCALAPSIYTGKATIHVCMYVAFVHANANIPHTTYHIPHTTYHIPHTTYHIPHATCYIFI